ncbi:MAG: VWA domain-containing protein, partial [Vicinamibacterales bacterium]
IGLDRRCARPEHHPNRSLMRCFLRVAAVTLAVACAGGILLGAAQAPASGPAASSSTPAPAAPPAAPVVPTGPVATPAMPVVISSPSADAYVSGPTPLRVSIDPSVQVRNVTFFVDGRQFCSLSEEPFECDWDAGSTISAHLIRLVVTPLGGDRIIKTMRTKGLGYADKVNVEAIQVTVTVTDDKGRFVGGLPRSAFRVLEDGKPEPITYFASEDVPLELIVAVDISGSMTPSMPKLKTAVKEFLVAVPPKNQVTLLGFNDSVFALTRKTTDPSERVRSVDRLAPWGATALYDVILRAVDMLGRQIGRKALVVFSDGEDQGSHVSLEDVERKLQASDVTLYMIAQGRGISQDYLKRTMQRLTVPTGGRTFTTDSVDQLHGAFEELLDELSHQYLIGYQPSNILRDDTWREIKVQVDGQTNVRARQGYRAAPFK